MDQRKKQGRFHLFGIVSIPTLVAAGMLSESFWVTGLLFVLFILIFLVLFRS